MRTAVVSAVLPADGAHGVTRSTLHGELFICVDEAVFQAKQFGTSWQLEIVRYVVHGVLHLRGHDDLQPAFAAQDEARRKTGWCAYWRDDFHSRNCPARLNSAREEIFSCPLAHEFFDRPGDHAAGDHFPGGGQVAVRHRLQFHRRAAVFPAVCSVDPGPFTKTASPARCSGIGACWRCCWRWR